MKFRLLITLAFVSLLPMFALPSAALADGLVVVNCPPIMLPVSSPAPLPGMDLITPIPPRLPPQLPPVRRDCATYLSVKNHDVTVTIDNQIARTHIDETFTNESAYSLEGTYIFPLPEDAAIGDFAMYVDGKRLSGQLLDRNQARQTYEDIVRTRRDPALLEYIGRNAFQARIFPISPRTDKRVEIEYSQVLKAENGLVKYLYPLDTEKFSPQPLKSVSINAAIKSAVALRAIYSPSHNVNISRDGDKSARVGYEDASVRPDRDFVLYYSVSQEDVGLSLLSYRNGNDDDFFAVLLDPKIQIQTYRVVEKDVVLVLDVSGSMQGAKIDQAKRALTLVLDQLNSGDRFNIISFSTGTSAFASSLQPASRRNEAKDFIARMRAEGSTDINRALLEAISNADKSRTTTIIFLTDGLPTTGETNAQRIISNAASAAPTNVRLFTFGVGDDVNTILLDSLAERLRGASGYIRPNEKIDEVVSAFYAKVSTPVLSDISIDWGEVQVSDMYPYPLPDLFAGTQLLVTGRYRLRTGLFETGGAILTVKGNVNGVPQTLQYKGIAFGTTGGDDTIPRLWATRKIGYLLNEIRLHGESREAVDEIVTLAVRYGIVTPYTSFLIDERQDVLTQSGRNEAAKQVQPAPAQQSGATAVQQSQDQNQLRGANQAPVAAAPTSAPSVRAGLAAQPISPIQTVGDKTFLLRNNVWTDSQFDPSKMATRKIEFGSEAYFALSANNAGWGKYIALGSRVIFVANNVAYEITDTGTGEANIGSAPIGVPSTVPFRVSSQDMVSATPASTSDSAPPAANALAIGLVVAIGITVVGLASAFGLIIHIAAKKK